MIPSTSPAPSRTTDATAAATDLRAVLTSIGETVYTWDIGTDRITWSGNVCATLRVRDAAEIGSGRAFARLVVPDAGVSRFDTVARSVQPDAGHGVPFQTTYAFRPGGGEPLWLQDTGRWFAGLDGRPARVHGVVRVVQAPAAAAGGAPDGDPLTGALTRQQLCDLLGDEIVRARKTQKSAGLAVVGIDQLASINEAYGFEVADEAIAGVAARLRGVMRRGDALSRHSGNKFGIVLTSCTDEQLPVAAARFVDAVRSAPVPTSAGPVSVTVRLGAVLLPRFGQTPGQALQNAEEALSDAKASPSRAFHVYAPDRRRDERRQSNRRFTDEIVAALNDRRVTLARQPVVASGSRRVAFEEALVRIRSREGVAMPAAQIIPLIERLGFVPLLDHRVLELVGAALAQDPASVLSMNVSRDTLRRADWGAALAAHFGTRPDAARRLIVEITETCLVDDVPVMADAIAAMRALGIRVAIDDFGSGHTSFRHLRDLGVDMVKLGGAFVQNLDRSTDDRFFVRTLVDLARHLGLTIVAEWVQDEEAARLLESWGIDYLQGELFGAAVTPGAAEAGEAA